MTVLPLYLTYDVFEGVARDGYANLFSTWQGLGDVINLFRTGTLGLEPLTARSGASTVERLRVPWTYCWSEGLIEKPDDWKEHIGECQRAGTDWVAELRRHIGILLHGRR